MPAETLHINVWMYFYPPLSWTGLFSQICRLAWTFCCTSVDPCRFYCLLNYVIITVQVFQVISCVLYWCMVFFNDWLKSLEKLLLVIRLIPKCLDQTHWKIDMCRCRWVYFHATTLLISFSLQAWCLPRRVGREEGEKWGCVLNCCIRLSK